MDHVIECAVHGVDNRTLVMMQCCSERQSQSEAVGDRFKEATNINQSLSTLGNVISGMFNVI